MEMDIHRIGGSSVENLRLRPLEIDLNPPGISVLRTVTAEEAVSEMLLAHAKYKKMHERATTVASTSIELIQEAGFDLIVAPSNKLPSHCRIIHPDGVAGFNDENLMALSLAFAITIGEL